MDKDSNNVDPFLIELVDKLTKTYKPLKVYLFGSRAVGTASPVSDYDILVVVPDDSPEELKSSTLAYEAMWGTSVCVDVLVWTESSFNKRLDIENSLPAKVAKEGRILYAA